MLELGGWLEDCLDPNIQPKKIEKIFNRGLQILGVKHQKIGSNPLLESIELKDGESIYKYVYREFIPNHLANRKKRDQYLSSIGTPEFEKVGKYPERTGIEVYQENSCEFLLTLTHTSELLKKLAAQKKAWNEVFPEWQQLDGGSIIRGLKNDYSSLSEALHEVDGIFKISKSFASGIDLKDELWCYGIILSHIFFDFLQSGGQPYVGFCNHCNRFIVGSRLKPDGTLEREFCSPRCRTNSKR